MHSVSSILKRVKRRSCLCLRRFCSLGEVSLSRNELLMMASLDNETFLSSSHLFQQVNYRSRSLIAVPQMGEFSIKAAGGYYSQLDGYSSNEDDIAQFLVSNVRVEMTYDLVGDGKQMTLAGSKVLGLNRAPPNAFFGGNAGRIGHETWTNSGTYATVGHVVAPFIDADGQPCDKDMVLINRNNHNGKKSQQAALYELKSISAFGAELECVSLNPERDLACLVVKEGAQSFVLKSKHFMTLGEFDANPQHLVLAGTRVATHATDTRSMALTPEELDFLYGPVGTQNIMAMKRGCVHEYCMPVQAKAWESATPGLYRGSILHKDFHQESFDHYLSTLNGHSGSNMSIEKCKVCAIHVSGDAQQLRQCNTAVLIDSTISDHVQPK